MSLGPITLIALEEKWMSLRSLYWNAVQPVRHTFKGRIRKSGKLYANVSDRIITDGFYGEYFLS